MRSKRSKGSDHYDLILLDIMMPGATGLEVLGKIREMDATEIHPSRDPHGQGARTRTGKPLSP